MYVILVQLLRPYPLLVFLCGVGLAVYWRRSPAANRKHLFRWVVLPYLLLYVISTQAFAHYAAGLFEWPFRPLRERPDQAQAIVVLGGGRIPSSAVEPRTRLGQATLRRCWRAAELYHQGEPCPVVVTGGKVDYWRPGTSEAVAMREHLVQLRVPSSQIIVEEASRDTHENAVRTRALLDQRGIDCILLVTDAIHLPRARRCFQRQGLKVIPAASHYETHSFQWEVLSFVPDPDAVRVTHAAFHELLGSLWNRLH